MGASIKYYMFNFNSLYDLVLGGFHYKLLYDLVYDLMYDLVYDLDYYLVYDLVYGWNMLGIKNDPQNSSMIENIWSDFSYSSTCAWYEK